MLKGFVYDLMRAFGGIDLASRVCVECKDNVVTVETDSDASRAVHGALFLCGEYKSVKCKFEQID